MTENTNNNSRMVAVRLPSDYHRALRRIAAEHDLANAEVVRWALDLLVRHERDGGIPAGQLTGTRV